jgi:hypothetical protein
LREKGVLDGDGIDVILDAASATLADAFDQNARALPKLTEDIGQMRIGSEKMLTAIRRHLTNDAQESESIS